MAHLSGLVFERCGFRVNIVLDVAQGGELYWYGSGGEILAETDGSGNTLNEYVFFGGKRIGLLPAGSTAQYYVEDSLGTSRVVTTNTGVVCYDADFYPYGGERPYTDTCTQNNYKFEGKERDTETGNDDFGARYYSNRFGRWLSADWSNVPVPVPYANLTNPQTLNLYSMVADDPESFADLDGHWCVFGVGTTCNPAPPPPPPPDPAKVHTDPPTPKSQPAPQRGLTVGVGVAGNADVGAVKAGAEINGTGVITGSVSSSGNVSVGAAASGAAVAYAGDHVAAAPKQDPTPLVAGAYAGVGGTLIVANTASSKGLSGPFETISANIGGGQGLSGSLSFDHSGTLVLQVTIGPGIGVSGWAVTTNTAAGCAGCE